MVLVTLQGSDSRTKRWGTNKQMTEGVGVGLSEMGPWEEMGTRERKQQDSVTAVPVHQDECENEGHRFLD